MHPEARRVTPGLHTAFLQALHGAPKHGQYEIVHAFLEGTTYRDLMRELGRSPPVDSNELFHIATSFASGEEAVGRSSMERKASAWTTRSRRAAI
jgi:hypothetical protein